ncbi:unnamed protein product [Brachionus calyciflorus]|uniref:Uncharacterized protein n=1 Tax=Brachionus calyciflorus TaxID=104777 RepID=A0A814NTG5_9BILA|nr:unnamed protein product [Brachionus calyciflorus]
MRNSILNGANKDLIHSLCECIFNILRGNVELTESDKTQLIKYKNSLRRFSSMLNKTLKKYNQSNNYTPRNISMNEPNNDLSDFTLRDNSLNNSRYSIKDPSDFSLRNISLNDSNHSLNKNPNSILNQSIFQRPPAETTRSKGPISDQTYREITEVAKKKKKVNEIRELNSRPKRRKPVNISKYWESFK